jgi:hypothetical protein
VGRLWALEAALRTRMKRAGREMSDDIIVAVHVYDSELGTRPALKKRPNIVRADDHRPSSVRNMATALPDVRCVVRYFFTIHHFLAV